MPRAVIELGRRPKGAELDNWHPSHRIEISADGVVFCENCGATGSDTEVCASAIKEEFR